MAAPVLSSGKIQDYKKLFGKLKQRKASADDVLFAETHSKVFSEINCLECANCCKTHSPIVLQSDIMRISKQMGISSHMFMSKYLLLDEDGDWVFHTQPCPFLGGDNRCTIYDARPKACREYPHTNRKRMFQIEKITMKNAEICPAVTRILDIVITKINSK